MSEDLSNAVDGYPERFEPSTMGGQLVEAEHLARYWWASSLAAGRRVLDAGCGTAYGTALLAAAGAREAVGVDRAADVVAAARGRVPADVRLVEGDLADLPFPDDSFDLVVCFEAIEHVDDPDRCLDELARVLAPGGLLAISSPNRDMYIPGNVHHVHEYLPEELHAALAARFAAVRLVRQRNWLASATMEDEEFAAADGAVLEGVRTRKVTGYPPGHEIFTLALAGDGELPRPESVVALTHVDELRRWLEWNQHVEGVLRDAEGKIAVIPTLGALLEERERELAAAREEVATVTGSRSWRLTAPLREAVRVAAPGGRALAPRVRAIAPRVRELVGRARRAAPARDPGPYAPPRVVTDPAECVWYHTMHIPGVGVVEGEWDLRDGVDEYLGGVPLEGRRVLEVGTASGFLCFEMERRGAEVVAYDLSERQPWDVVPFDADDLDRSEVSRRLNNGWWLAHRAFGSSARVAYGTVYEVPASIGPVDVATFGCVLLHVRDPFLALQRGLALTEGTVVVTELAGDPVARDLPQMTLIPDPATGGPRTAWWYLPPELVRRMVGVLGFERTELTFHTQTYMGQPCELYTLVGHRTRPR